MSGALQQIAAVVAEKHVRCITTDVFDTLLLRNPKPEKLRYAQIAKLQASQLHQSFGATVDATDLFQTRLLATQIAYQVTPPNQGERDGCIDDINQLIVAAYDLPAAAAELLLEVEIAYEKENLRPNRPLATCLERMRRDHGCAIYFLSDMYLRAPQVSALIKHAFPREAVCDDGLVSCDLTLTKRGGGLFRHFLAQNGYQAAEVLHLGDSRESDFDSPRRLGMQAVYLPRNLMFRLIKHAWEFVAPR